MPEIRTTAARGRRTLESLTPIASHEPPSTSHPPSRSRATATQTGAYCTLPVTDVVPFSVNVHVLVLLPPLGHAPDQMASRPFVTLSVIDVPIVNDAEPVVPTLTLMPAGFDNTRSPLRPVAVTVSVAAWPGGVTVSDAVRVVPL